MRKIWCSVIGHEIGRQRPSVRRSRSRARVYQAMRLMRQFATRLLTVLLCAGSMLLAQNWNLPNRAMPPVKDSSSAEGSSCPMCRKAGPGHHCSCCKGETCTCKVSSNEQSEPAPIATAKPGLLRAWSHYPVTLQSTPLLPFAPDSTHTPYLPVPTPPPKH